MGRRKVMKKISVIIPCHNLIQTPLLDVPDQTIFDVCMQSVLYQTLGEENIEVILVDDASTDGGYTKNVLTEYEKQYPKQILVVLLSENQRQGGARNVGLSYATGEYVAFLDADDWVELCLYEKAYRQAAEVSADMVYFFHDVVKGSLSVPMDDMDTPAGVCVISDVETRKAFLMSQIVDYRCTTKLYRRQMLLENKILFPAHMIYEEPLFTYPCMFYGTTYVILPEILYHYRINHSSTMHINHNFEALSCHPKVQLLLFTEMVDRGLFEIYHEEISYHFLHSYFYETLLFAALQKIEMDVNFFRQTQNTVLSLIPDWKHNTYIQREPEALLSQVLQTGLTHRFSQSELDRFVSVLG